MYYFEQVKGGFEEKWTTTVEEYLCPICLLVSREAVACACGALFCEDCRALCSSCPNCRSNEAVHPAFRDRRAIQNLMVACPSGCAVGKLNTNNNMEHNPRLT